MLSFPHAKTHTSNLACALRRSFYFRTKRTTAPATTSVATAGVANFLATIFPTHPRPRPTKSHVRPLRPHSPPSGHLHSFCRRPKSSRQTHLRRAHREHYFHATALEPRPGHLSTAPPRSHSSRRRTKTLFPHQQRPLV